MARIAILIVLLAGCASTPTVENFAASCNAYGFQRGTVDWSNCLQTEALAYQQRVQAQGAALQALGASLQQQSQAMALNRTLANQQRAATTYYQPVVNCRRNAWGVQCR